MKANIPYQMSANQRKAMNAEINKQIGENLEKLETNIMAIFLWEMHEQPTKYGKKRLRRSYNRFYPILKELADHYSMGEDDYAFLCKHKLADIGVDIDQWAAETKDKASLFNTNGI